MSTSTPTTTDINKKKGAVIVIRHGERLDYVCRSAGTNWIPTSSQPWNPPLTVHGLQQAHSLGEKLHEHIQTFDLPQDISHVYSSPLLRCVQTSAEIVRGYEKGLTTEDTTKEEEEETKSKNKRNITTKVKVEHGLVESMNEDWFRSWCLTASDSTWGFKKKQIPIDSIDEEQDVHAKAKEPVQNLFQSVNGIAKLHRQHGDLFEKIMTPKNEDGISSSSCTSSCLEDVAKAYEFEFDESADDTTSNNSIIHQDHTVVDLSYTQPFHTIENNYQWNTFETRTDQCNRMENLVQKLAQDYPDQTVVIVSHGGPVTHLFECLTDKTWKEHGMSKYTCCSIYVHEDGGKSGFQNVLVNDTSHLEDKSAGAIEYVT